MIQYLSPTSIDLFYTDPKEYYIRYLCPEKPPRSPQTAPMSAGSSFDAYVKSYLHSRLFGSNHPDSAKFGLKELFEAQVEIQLRDKAWEVGKYLFEQYQASGALSDLMLELSSAISEPRFELEVRGVVEGHREGVTKDVKGVVLLGKPDLFYINKYGAHVILDFKVNGFYGNYTTSPMPGYVRLRSQSIANRNKYRVESCHSNCRSIIHKGIMINDNAYLENYNQQWAHQLSIYAWLCGVSVGDDFIVAVDQICCNGKNRDGNLFGYPEIRVAEHRLKVSSDYQYQILGRAQHTWEVVHSDHFFRDLTFEESKSECQMLDELAKKFNSKDINENDKWLLESSRK